jgi:Rne/Rng family ribonuclease
VRRIIVSFHDGLLTRAAVIDDDRLVAFLREVHGHTRPVGQIHLGEIIRDVRGTNGAFVELAGGAKGFLEQSDILTVTATAPRPPAFVSSKSGSAPVAQLPPPHTRLIVQVKRESASGKLVQLTTDVSLAGKLVVLRPYRPIRRITKALKDEAERDALHDTLRSIKPPGKAGVIVRTAGRSAPESALKAEVEALAAMWEQLVETAAGSCEPRLLFKEPELLERLVRDDLGMNDTEIIADSPAAVARLKDALRASPDASRVTLKHHRASLPIFHALHIEKEIENLYNRELSLPSGGNLVIEYTEAMVTVDVNSGAARGDADVVRTNFEAADALFRQLRLRDIGGLIACNFVGMREAQNRKALEECLRTLAAEDRGNVWVGDLNPLGVAVLTRRTDGAPAAKLGLVRCPRCGGPGLIADDVSAAVGFLDALRLKGKTKAVMAKVSPRVLAILADSAAFEQVKADFGKKLVLEESPCDAAADFEVR